MQISIHAPRGGSDKREHELRLIMLGFNPRSPWGERQPGESRDDRFLDVSIHAPRGGSDPDNAHRRKSKSRFNPRSPWGERPSSFCPPIKSAMFQSTLPVGGATLSKRPKAIMRALCFNPRSPWGERQIDVAYKTIDFLVSIHAPRGGSDARQPDRSMSS